MRQDPWIIIDERDPNVITHICKDRHQFLYYDVDISSDTIWIPLIIKAMRSDESLEMREIQM